MGVPTRFKLISNLDHYLGLSVLIANTSFLLVSVIATIYGEKRIYVSHSYFKLGGGHLARFLFTVGHMMKL